MNYSDFIFESLFQAGEIARTSFGHVSGTTKPEDNNQVLTKTDLEIGKMLISEVERKFPQHNIIDEEAGVIDKKSQFTWVIDPIDGTSNFANGVPIYGVMMGLLDGATPIAGGIAIPSSNDIYIAQKGMGAFCNKEKIQVTNEEKLMSTLVAYGIDGHQENPELTKSEVEVLGNLILNIRNLRDTGCCFDTVMVACGKFGGYLNRTSKIWDNVAQQILLEEAGGVYTDFFGKPMDYSSPLSKAKDNFTFCTASPELHKQLQRVIFSK